MVDDAVDLSVAGAGEPVSDVVAGGLGDHPGVVLAQGAAPVDQHPQHRQLLVGDHGSQAGDPGRDQGHGVGVGGVGLAALPGGEDPHPRRELRWDVDDVLAVG